MYHDRVTSREHRQFVKKLPTDTTKKYWLVFLDQEPTGVFDLTNVTNDSAKIGLYLSPDKIGQGLGAMFLRAALNFIKKKFRFKKLLLEVFKKNSAAINLYQQLGFQLTGTQSHAKGELIQMELSLK